MAWLPFGEALAQPTIDKSAATDGLNPRAAVLALARKLLPSADLKSQISDALASPIDRSNFYQELQVQFGVYLPLQSIEGFRNLDDVAAEISNRLDFQKRVVDRLKVTLSKYRQGNDFWSDGKQVPKNRLKNFYQKQPAVPQVEQNKRPIAFFDATVFGSGVEGMFFGRTGMYYRTDWTVSAGPRNGFIPYEDFLNRKFDKGGFLEVSLDRGQNFVVAGSGLSSERLIEILNDVQKAIIEAWAK